MGYVTSAMRDLVGVAGEPRRSPDVVEEGALRRFGQAVMVPGRVEHPRAAAAAFAPALYPVHAFQRPLGTPDPFDQLETQPDWDGINPEEWYVHPLELPLDRTLNGGTEAQFHSYAEVGERIVATSRYVDISDHQGRSGPFVVVTVETDYRAGDVDGRRLCRVRETLIRR